MVRLEKNALNVHSQLTGCFDTTFIGTRSQIMRFIAESMNNDLIGVACFSGAGG